LQLPLSGVLDAMHDAGFGMYTDAGMAGLHLVLCADQTFPREDIEGLCRSLVSVHPDLAAWGDANGLDLNVASCLGVHDGVNIHVRKSLVRRPRQQCGIN
jgi:hypothetical protein